MQYRYLLILFLTLAGWALCAQKPGRIPRGHPSSAATRTIQPRPDPTLNPLNWRVRDRMLMAGATEEIDFVALDFTDIAAYQFALRFDTAILHFEQIEVLTNGIPLDPDGNFGLYNIQAGEIRNLWSVAHGLNLPPATKVFRLRFTVKSGGKLLSEVLALAPDVLTPVAYNSALADKSLHLLFGNYYVVYPREQEVTEDPSLALTAFPNPCTNQVTVRFSMRAAGVARLQVVDSSGRLVLAWEKWCSAGDQEETLHFEQLSFRGLLNCTLITPDAFQTATLLRQ